MSGGFHIPEDREWDDIRLEDLYRQFGGLGKCSDIINGCSLACMSLS